jgi:hypothetical protein
MASQASNEGKSILFFKHFQNPLFYRKKQGTVKTGDGALECWKVV